MGRGHGLCRGRLALALACMAVVALTSAAAAAASAAGRSVPQGFVGVNWNGPLDGTALDGDSETRLMVRSGIESARFPIYWNLAQPYASWTDVPAGQRGRFVDVGGVPTDFSGSDRTVALAAARRVNALPVVLLSPSWAARDRTQRWSPPSDPATYARFLGALVRRYGPNGSFWAARPDLPRRPLRDWQVWNEPGQRFFWAPKPSAKGYVTLLRASRKAIRKADPKARVVLAGLNALAWKALSGLYAAAARGLFDVAAVHPYSLKVGNVVRIIELFRRVMVKHGDRSLPIVVTEFGWPSSFSTTGRIYGFEMTERGQAKRATEVLPRLAAERRRLGIRRVLWETWISNDRVKDYPSTGRDCAR